MVPAKNYELTEKDFEKFRELINQSSGIFFDQGKRDLLRLGLADRAEAIGAESLSDYYRRLTDVPDRELELRRLLDHLSVQETQFFRNLPQFDALRKYVIPELIRQKADGSRSLRLWSAGCSTGQEPYSLAMSVLDALPDPDSWDVQILGTDLSETALGVAKNGWYEERRLTGIDRGHRDRYFIEQGGGYKVAEPVRRLVRFVRHNMLTEALPVNMISACDVIFCRNVIIYFTHETAKYVIEHFFDILNPDGYLFLGHSETLWKMSSKYSLVEMGDAFIYKKSPPDSIEGRRFISDRRLREAKLPPGVSADRRFIRNRRKTRQTKILTRDSLPEDRTGETKAPVTAGTLLDQARVNLDRGEYKQAITLIEDAGKNNGDAAEIYFLKGIACERQDDLDSAAEAFRQTIYYDNTHSLAYFHLANILERLGQSRAAVREYHNAIKALKNDAADRWEIDLGAFNIDSLMNLCKEKIKQLRPEGS